MGIRFFLRRERERQQGDTPMKSFLLLGFVFLTGCSLFVTKPEIAVKSVTLAGLDSSGIKMDFLLAVTNPNAYGIKLTGHNYNLLVSDLPLAKGENREVVEFKGNAATDVRIPVIITFHDLLEVFKRSPDLEHIPYHLTAVFALQTPFGAVTIPVDKSGSFAVPQKYRPGRFLQQFR
jgi:LEA14-like dessication related protein